MIMTHSMSTWILFAVVNFWNSKQSVTFRAIVSSLKWSYLYSKHNYCSIMNITYCIWCMNNFSTLLCITAYNVETKPSHMYRLYTKWKIEIVIRPHLMSILQLFWKHEVENMTMLLIFHDNMTMVHILHIMIVLV